MAPRWITAATAVSVAVGMVVWPWAFISMKERGTLQGLTVYVPIASPVLDSTFVRACEEALKDMLRAPATYRRVSVDASSEELSSRTLDHKTGAVRHTAWFEYDAANGFGALLRGSSTCTYDTVGGRGWKADAYSVRVDGLTKLERIAKALDEARRDGQ